MNRIFTKNHRLFLMVLTIILSLIMVGAALAAAGAMGRNASTPQPPAGQVPSGGRTEISYPPSPLKVASEAPVIHSKPDPVTEQMRQKVMESVQKFDEGAFEDLNLPRTDADEASGAQSIAPAGAGTQFLPGGIVIDTFQDRIFGNIPSYSHLTVLRSGDGAYGASEADEMGVFWTGMFDGAGEGTPVDIMTGDELTIQIDAVPATYEVGYEPSGNLDVINDVITGTIPFDTGGTQVTATIGLYGEMSTAYGLFTGVTDASGNFSIPLNIDIGPENFASLDYQLNGFIQRTYIFPQNVFLLMQNSKIMGYAPRFTSVHVTVFIGDTGDPRWQGDAYADYPFGWFKLDWVEMAPGDHVQIDYWAGPSINMEYTYASWFTFEGDDTVNGTTDPNVDLRVSFIGWDGSGYSYHYVNTTSDGSGNFTAVFPEGGIRPDTRVEVAIMDDSGAGSYMVTGQPYVETTISPYSDIDGVWGRVDLPNEQITINLIRGEDVYTRTRPVAPSDPGNLLSLDNYYLVWWDFGDGQGDRPINFETGDVLRIKTPNNQWDVSVVEPYWTANPISNEIEGQISSGETGEVMVKLSQPFYAFFGEGMFAEASAQATPGYTLSFHDYDVRAGLNVETYFYDPITGFSNHFTDRNHLFRTMDASAIYGHTNVANESITLRLLDPITEQPIYTSTNDLDGDPFTFYFDFSDCDPVCAPNPPLQPGFIVEVLYGQSGEGDGRLTYQAVSVEGDVNADKVYSTGGSGFVDLWGGYDQTSFDRFAPTLNSAAVLDTMFWNNYDLGWGDSIYMGFANQMGNRQIASNLLGEIRRVEFWQDWTGSTGIWGVAQPDTWVTVRTSRGDVLTGWADARCDGCFGVGSAYLEPSDLITVTAGAGNYPVYITFPEMSADGDSMHDTVSGHISYSDKTVEIYPWWGEEMTTTQTDSGGNYSASFIDIPPQARGYIRFYGENPQTVFHRPFYDLQPVIAANYAHEWVEGQYDSGVQVWITLTNSLGEIKATASGVTGPIPWWGSETGFSTNYNVPWDGGAQPDLQVGDYVYLRLGNGRTGELQIGEIDGWLDSNNNTFTGSLNVPWLTDPVWVDCAVWVENGPGLSVGWVDPQGGSFTCDFSSVGWDLIPGEDVGVSYHEADGDTVYNVFREPAPDLRINLWGDNQAAEGSNYILEIHYNNDGWVTAPEVVITQTLNGLSYLGDTSGIVPTVNGNTVVWQMGDLPYNHNTEKWFFVFVHVDNLAGEMISSNADINSSMLYMQDEGRKHSYWETQVIENHTDVGINKWSWTGDPVPGQDYVYTLQSCNNGDTASLEVFITDTLPVSTTLVEWWGQYQGWEEVSATEHQLVVKRASIQGNWCGDVYAKVHLSEQARQGMELYNQAWIWAGNDLDPNNNMMDNRIYVGRPYYNLHLENNWDWGQFVPGGVVGFEFYVNNWGNMPTENTVITTTLPPGTELLYTYNYDWDGWKPFTPTIVTDEYVVWDVGTLGNGYGINIGVQLQIADDATPGTPIVVQNSVKSDALEVRYDDNQRTFNEQVNSNGPNLRVDKHTNWWWNVWGDENGEHRGIGYELRILNVGTTYLEDPIVTDTYPISTTFSECWWNHGPFIDCQVDELNHQVVYHLDYLNPGETASAMLGVLIPDEEVPIRGLAYNNQADISDFDDIFPQDNHDELTSYTGSDIFVRKWLKAGELKAGELITYTVEFGNSNRWPIPWDWAYGSHITDTLPTGLTFVKAIGYWDLAHTWDPEINGQQLVWGWSTMWSDSVWTFDLVAQVDENVLPGAELLNTIEAWGDEPDKFDLNPENNFYEYMLQIPYLHTFIPFIMKMP